MVGLNRVVLVSGAASGLGLATVRELVRADWTVYAGFRPNGRSAPDLLHGNAIRWLPLDVTDSEARSVAVASIEREQGRLDALVNSAGVNASGPLEEVPDRVLRQVMEVNFFGAIGMTRDCLPLMRRTALSGSPSFRRRSN
ncbi:MAG: SDR family NAD(P)-dependent oxidoreductase [Proteobacteria bacterium]|nr:SDR family NAD(P)-dependent oxidoreductase [Pseudomonadota bacterium]